MFKLDLEAPIYLGTADDAVQSGSKYKKENLIFEYTVLSILGYKTIIGTPFLWQSKLTLEAVEKRIELFDSEIGLTFGGRPETGNIDEYFNQRKNDTKSATKLLLRTESSFRSERPGSIPLNWQRNISPGVKIEPRDGSVEKYFRSLFINDSINLYSQKSIFNNTAIGYGAKYSKIGKRRTDYQINKIGEEAYKGHFSRAFVESAYLKENFNITFLDQVLLRTSALYQAANGYAHAGALFTTPQIYNYLPENMDLTTINRFSVSPLNPYLFGDVLSVLGVKLSSWINLKSFSVLRIASTLNPLSMFVRLYKQYLMEKLFFWYEHNEMPSYSAAVFILQKELFYDNDWHFLEKLAVLPGRKFDSLVAGVTFGGAAAIFGQSPLTFASASKNIVDFGYKFIDGISFFEILKMRKTLRKYLLEMKLI